MRLQCGGCAAAIEAKDIDLARSLARCSFCGAVMDLGRREGAERGGRFPEVERPEVPLPERFRTGKDADGAYVSWRWFRPVTLFLLVFAIGWNGFLVGFFTMASKGGAPPVFFLFPLIHVAVGVGIGYAALTGLLNSTTVRVGGGTLRIRHAPLPWTGNRTLRRDEIEQLWCARKVGASKHGSGPVTFEVRARLKGGKSLTLLKGLDAEDQALFLEQRIERGFGIRDRPEAGELPR